MCTCIYTSTHMKLPEVYFAPPAECCSVIQPYVNACDFDLTLHADTMIRSSRLLYLFLEIPRPE